MVVNSFQSGIPCVFLFSNREDKTVLAYFFESKKSRVDLLESKIFMTEDFGKYIEVEYSKRAELWAACHTDLMSRRLLMLLIKNSTFVVINVHKRFFQKND